MDLTQKHRTICLKKYGGESCKGEPVEQEYSWDKASKCPGGHISRLMVSGSTCVNIEMTSTLQFGSYKFKLVCSSPALLSRLVLRLTSNRTDVRRVEGSARSTYDTYRKYGRWCMYLAIPRVKRAYDK